MELLHSRRRPKLIMEFYPDGLTACGTEPLEIPRVLFDLGYQLSIVGDAGLQPVSCADRLLRSVELGKSVNLFCE
ncbi:MAG TPA: hypothetical protein VGU64_17935, partial [Terriglobales bacterium]|nr:hypothetical protein [Terriglobales bacterium]